MNPLTRAIELLKDSIDGGPMRMGKEDHEMIEDVYNNVHKGLVGVRGQISELASHFYTLGIEHAISVLEEQLKKEMEK